MVRKRKRRIKEKVERKKPKDEWGMLIDELKEATDSRFCCGGTFSGVVPVDIYYKLHGEGKEARFCSFPLKSDEDFAMLASECSEASFGRGSERVQDKSYRNAMVLHADRFCTTFDPSSILSSLKRSLFPRVGEDDDPNMEEQLVIRPELYALNIYFEGGFFKSHQDTPRGGGMFGSLVVSLPTIHTGGELVVRHRDTEHIFSLDDFENGHTRITWAAFFSDCEHEVKPVQQGNRITLTYNLSFPLLEMPTLKRTILDSPVYTTLAKIDQMKIDLWNKPLVFEARHEYTNETLTRANEDPLRVLKGADSLLFLAGTALGFSPRINGIF